MYGNSAAQSYQAVQVGTASPEYLVLTLYQGVITAIDRAEQAIASRRVAEAHEQLVKAQRLVSELMGSLDLEQGEVAHNLMGLYVFFNRELAQANLKKEGRLLPVIKRMLQELLEAWQSALVSITTAQAAV